MSSNFITGISLITAFAGGMVALFAPCCITFLLPAYLANIFREKRRVVWATVIFGLGIATILVPTALGIRFIGNFFDSYHTQTYIAGGIFMMLLGAMQLTGKKIILPMLNLTINLHERHDVWSIYLLGIFSGITTSCCTPVLAGVLTLSFLSPTLPIAGLAGLAYVSGMVFPLVVMAAGLEKINWTALPVLRNKTMKIGEKPVRVTDVIAGVLYIATGITFSVLALAGKIDPGTPKPIEATLGTQTMAIVRTVRQVPGMEYVFAVLLILFIVLLLKKGRSS